MPNYRNLLGVATATSFDAPTYKISGSDFAKVVSTNYNGLHAPGGGLRVALGDGTSKKNYYDNDDHFYRDLSSNPLMTISANTGSPGNPYVHFLTGLAIPAGGKKALQIGDDGGGMAAIGISFGSGAPTHSAKQGWLYLRTDGTTTNDRAYINTNGTTGWTALITAA